jgi:ribosomal protein L22
MADEPDTTETPETPPEAEAKPTTGKARGAGTRAAAKPKADAEAKAAGGDAAEAKPKRTRAAAKPKAEAGEKAAAAKADDAKADAAEAKPKPTRAAAKSKAEAADEKPAAKPARRSREAAEAPTRPVVRAQAKYVRSSARKARLVCDHIRGKSVEEARAILAFTPRAVAKDWSKVLESAVANAEHNHELDGDDLVVKAAHADEGPTLKRFRPRAMGRATPIRKRTSHLTILLTPKE